uniref:Uncharacterized protein n=1 Tax=Aegilops tauschii TaxID=37682 RepID=M8BV58_AEGTA
MSWVVDMEKKLEDIELPVKAEKWPKHSIFRVPLRFKIDGRANSLYKPQTVSLGPFHHHDRRGAEEHKLRAVRHLLGLAAAEEVADELQDAYMDLGDEWRGEENNMGKFLKMMITDGCFLLEVMRGAATIGKKDSIPIGDYAHGDPIFSRHGIQHIKPFVQRDMLLVENQLPLRLLEKIVAAETGTFPVYV